jgi:hypothetical protein
MKGRALTHICLAIALIAYGANLSGGYQISSFIVGALLVISSLVLFAQSRFYASWWIKMVYIFNRVDVSYTAIGFGFTTAGASLIRPGWLPLGIILIIVGALVIGVGINKQLKIISVNLCPFMVRICSIRLLGRRGRWSICEKRCSCKFLCYTLSDKGSE